MYDVVIVGAGISGLYAAYKIKRDAPTTSLLILKKIHATELAEEWAWKCFMTHP